MLLYVAPPLVLTCQITVGVGDPMAAAVKAACCPAARVMSTGFCVMTGGPTLTVSVATVVVAVPVELVNLARNR